MTQIMTQIIAPDKFTTEEQAALFQKKTVESISSIIPRQETYITFPVSDVSPATKPLDEVPFERGIMHKITGKSHWENGVMEAYSQNARPLVDDFNDNSVNPIILAANLAYADHRQLILSPDMIWLTIAQGFSMHVNQNFEALRSKFVSHSGKAQIEVRRNTFTRGNTGNDWESVFSEFSTKIAQYIGEEQQELVVKKFSTTGMVEQAAMEVTLMETVQSYFDYQLTTMCGIPLITLEGTPQDWAEILAAANKLISYDLGWWTTYLLPVLAQFVRASQGDVDTEYWQSFYKINRTSGGPFITGHIVNLFPYLNNYKGVQRNEKLGESTFQRQGFCGLKSSDFSKGISRAPFKWLYYNEEFPMDFIAGMVGVTQDKETLAVRPEFGWAVTYRQDEPQED